MTMLPTAAEAEKRRADAWEEVARQFEQERDRYATALRLIATMGEEYQQAFRESDPNASGRFSRIAVTARMSLNPGAVDPILKEPPTA